MELINSKQEEEAIKKQEILSKQVIKIDDFGQEIKIVSGVDVAYNKKKDVLIAAAVNLDSQTLEVIEKVKIKDKVCFPYIPGLFSFRELPPLLKALEKLTKKPDLIVCDGQGIAHPRRFGLASHLGIVTNIPTIGCGKTRLVGEYNEPGKLRGDYSPLIDKNEIVGRVLRTQDNVKPVFVSIGHKISIESVTEWVLKLSVKYRLPQTTRFADHEVRMAMKEFE